MNGIMTQSLKGKEHNCCPPFQGEGKGGGGLIECLFNYGPINSSLNADLLLTVCNRRAISTSDEVIFSCLVYLGVTFCPAKVYLPPLSPVMAKLNAPVDGLREPVNTPVSLAPPSI